MIEHVAQLLSGRLGFSPTGACAGAGTARASFTEFSSDVLQRDPIRIERCVDRGADRCVVVPRGEQRVVVGGFFLRRLVEDRLVEYAAQPLHRRHRWRRDRSGGVAESRRAQRVAEVAARGVVDVAVGDAVLSLGGGDLFFGGVGIVGEPLADVGVVLVCADAARCIGGAHTGRAEPAQPVAELESHAHGVADVLL